MTRRKGPRLLSALVLVMACTGACGKKGDPRPPLRPVPARISDLTARRLSDRIELRFTVPLTNADGSTPPAISRVEVYGLVMTPEMAARGVRGAPPPPPAAAGRAAAAAAAPRVTAAELMGDPRNLRTRMAVGRPQPDDRPALPADSPTAPPSPPALFPGDPASYVETLDPATLPAGTVLYFAAVAVSGTGRGRFGPPSEMLAIPMTPLPVAPAALTLTHDEQTLHVSWQPRAATQVFDVYRVNRDAPADRAELLTPSPLTTPTLSIPVGEFGRERCFSVRPLLKNGSVTIEGLPGSAQCITPVDTFPPPTPTGVQVILDGPAVIVIWNSVEAADLAGYIVLRGEGGGESLQPLMRAPVTETTYRDTTVVPNTTYVYAVYAVDKAQTPNISQLSSRETITVR